MHLLISWAEILLAEMQERYANLRTASLEDLQLDGHEHIFWQE